VLDYVSAGYTGDWLPESIAGENEGVIHREPAVRNGCCKNLGPHRATFNPINGRFWQSKTFAIDFLAVNAQGIGHSGDGSKLDQYPYYGTDILAAKGGKVVEVVTDLPDQIPNQDPVGTTLETAAGNNVIIDMGNGQYALYAHLKPYSVTVHVGDVVADGQKLGLLGNSGNTTGPHLHFQVMDRLSVLKANGLPFVFDSFVLAGTVTDSVDGMGNNFSGGVRLPIQPVGKSERNAMPLVLDIINIP
jgi:murein DD-endopeptidase MepM/ murein hydrolase activator NlpD